MIAKIRNNFKLANVLSKTLLVCTFVLASWKDAAGALSLVFSCAPWTSTILLSLFAAGIVVVVAHFLPSLYLQLAKIYTVPKSEFSLFSTLAFATYYLVLALFNLIYFVAPTLIVWGSILFPTISVIGVGLCFYLVTSKLYFNDLTRPFYFASLSIIVIVLAVLGGVL